MKTKQKINELPTVEPYPADVIHLESGDVISVRGCLCRVVNGAVVAENPKNHGIIVGDLARQRKDRQNANV